jgi:cell division protein FtsL
MKDFAISAHTPVGPKILQGQRISKRVQTKISHPSLALPGLFFLLIISILLYVWTRVQVVQYGYEISSALRAKEAANIAHNERTLELATLRSAQQVEQRARQKMGMAPPRKDQLVIIQ